MLITSIILSLLAIICCIIELIYMIIQKRRINRKMALLTPQELKYLRCDIKTSKKAYKAIKKAYENGCSFVDTADVYPTRKESNNGN